MKKILKIILPLSALLVTLTNGAVTSLPVIEQGVLGHYQLATNEGSLSSNIMDSQSLAYGFVVTGNDFQLSSVYAKLYLNAGTPTLRVELRSDARGHPGGVISGGILAVPAIELGTSVISFRPTAPLTLSRGQTYWVVFQSDQPWPNAFQMVDGTAGPSDPAPYTENGAAYHAFQWYGFGQWQAYTTRQPIFGVSAAVPEPNFHLVAAFGASLLFMHRRVPRG